MNCEPATLGSSELAHLGQGGSVGQGWASAHLALSLRPDPFPERHCSLRGQLRRGTHALPASSPLRVGSDPTKALQSCSVRCLLKHLLWCIAGWWAAVSQGPSMSSPEKNSRGVWVQAGGVVTPETCSCHGGRNLGSKLSVWGFSAQNHVWGKDSHLNLRCPTGEVGTKSQLRGHREGQRICPEALAHA